MGSTSRRRLASHALCALLALAPGAAAAGPQAVPPAALPAAPPGVEPRADEVLRRMAALLSGARRFQLEAEETFDAEFARAYRIQLTNVRSVTVERPSRFTSVAEGDTAHRSSWYDGRTLSVLDRKRNLYAVLEAPGTIDAVLDTLARDYDVQLPLSDIVYADPYAALMDGVLYGKYLGVHRAAGAACHHLSFGQEGVAWQIWVDAGAQPLPRKLAIAYWDLPGVPQFQAVFRKWDLAPSLGADHFRFTAPAAARRIEIAELQAALTRD